MFKKKISPFACIMISIFVGITVFVATYARAGVTFNTRLAEERSRTAPLTAASGLVSKADGDVARYEKLAELIKAAKEDFLFDVDDDAIWEAVYASALESLGDKYTYYLTEEQYYDRFLRNDTGVAGIGVRVVFEPVTGGIYVADVMESTPASEAGLTRGDVIVSAGDVTAGDGYETLVKAVGGEEGSEVTITVLRGQEVRVIPLTRRMIPEDCVFSSLLPNGVGLMTIVSFNAADADEQFEKELKKLIGLGCEKLIFDVRDNPGGRLDKITAILDMIMPEGDIVSYFDESGKKLTVRADAEYTKMPYAVVCNGGTASAAELFTAALKESGAAVTVGETTFGKGIMQTIYRMSDGSGYSLTTSYYFPPSGVNFHGVGVKPEYEVAPSGEKGPDYYEDPLNDSQIKKAYGLLNTK